VTVNWHEAECRGGRYIIAGIRFQSEYEPPTYEVKEILENGKLEEGSTDEVDEDMIA